MTHTDELLDYYYNNFGYQAYSQIHSGSDWGSKEEANIYWEKYGLSDDIFRKNGHIYLMLFLIPVNISRR